MVGKKDIRSYEVSIWTLQDSFITVLKPANLEYKGSIQNGKITLQDDGENRISFSIPMYIVKNGEFIENPLWYSKKKGYLIANLRKLKVIFNKKTINEKVFEFLITKVTEKHEGFEKTCEVEGEGLAFNELGKQGYKISLSADDLYAEIGEELDTLEAIQSEEEIASKNRLETIIIKNNINYWVDKVLEGTKWKYSVQMDWSIADGIIDNYKQLGKSYEDLTEEEREQLNTNRANRGLRRCDCIYEDIYVSSWDIVNNSLIPTATVDMMEKLRIIEGSESNRYNLIQTIAETFEVYTKFKYYYDDSYHIIGREVIFYNNFLNENDIIDLNYSYDTQSISRELDAADIVTKMYVKSLDDETYTSGFASIADTKANKTGEDYLLNFDYLYDIKTINDEQYNMIKIFEDEVFKLNQSIIQKDNEIINLNKKILDAEIARDNALLITKEAQENINYINDQIQQINNAYKDENGVVKTEWNVLSSNPAFVYVSRDSNSNNYLGKISSQYSGIIPNSIYVYSNRNDVQNSKVAFGYVSSSENSETVLIFKSNITVPENGYFYATFKYKPTLKNEQLLEKYTNLYNANIIKYNDKVEELGRKIDDNGEEIKIGEGLKDDLEEKEQEQKELYNQKKQLISKFENMMGPALREGNWQPENDYSNFGDQYDEIVIPSYNINSIINPSDRLNFIWDEELFDDEEKNYYESGINQEKNYYPCIKLTNNSLIEKLKDENFRNNLTFVYKKNNNESPYLLPQGTSCKFAFLKEKNTNNNIIPVLMITNLDYGINLQQDLNSAYIAAASVDILLGNFSSDDENIFSISAQDWITNLDSYIIVYPRLHFNFENLKIGEGELFLNIYRQKEIEGINVYTYIKKLQDFIDYYILSRDGEKYITIKPEVLIAGKVGEAKIKVNYCISNTALQIYLDAIKIMKENAYPKVSYTVSNILSQKLLHDTYNRIGQLAHINDSELKFHNVMGYISAVELDLDKPWEDNITIKNYKTKFEDLFSTIVAQTEEMKKNAAKLTIAANAFTPNGMLVAPFTQESLLSSPVVLNNLIKNNADIIATKAVGEAASDKAALAMTKVYSIMNGNTGIAFTGNNIDRVALNQDDGLLIAGTVTYNTNATKSVFFKLDNAHMGFFEGSVGDYSTPKLYYENGDLALAGTIYANHGWFGGEEGWIIGEGNVDVNSGNIVNKIKNSSDFPASNSASKTMTAANLGGLFYSANGKVIFTAGTENKAPMIVLNKDGFSQPTQPQNAVFLFDGSSLYIDGTITTAAGNIGGWYIGPQHIGSSVYRADCKVGMSSLHGVTEPALSFWAGGDNPRADVNSNLYLDTNKIAFCVWEDGAIKATKGTIGGWAIGTYQLNAGSSNTYVGLNAGAQDNNNPNGEYAFWAGATAPGSANFSVKKSGVITAKSGTIGGWTIGSNYIGSGASRGQSRVGISVFSDDNSYDGYAAFWAGADVAESAQFQISNAKFQVTQTGTLTATDAHITGEITATSGSFTGVIKARSGEIGASNGNKIIIGGVNETNNNRAYIYSGSKSTKTANQNGFYIGTDGIALGQTTTFNNTTISKFQVNIDGTLYATNANISGTIIATSGSIGSLNINSDGLVTTITENNVSRTSVFKATGLYGLVIGSSSTSDYTNAPFRVTNTGQLTATGANITGEITATSGSFTGTITANGGTIGGWTINPQNSSSETQKANALVYNSNSNTNYLKTADMGILPGASASSSTSIWPVFWIGGKRTLSYTTNGNTESELAPFRITKEGKLYATNAEIIGTITASSGKIGNWNINNGNDQGLSCTIIENNVSRTSAFKAGGTYGLVIGSPSSSNYNNAPFRVTNTGKLYATGAVITNGEISLTDTSKTYTGELSSSQFRLLEQQTEASFIVSTATETTTHTETYTDINGVEQTISYQISAGPNFSISNMPVMINLIEGIIHKNSVNIMKRRIELESIFVDQTEVDTTKQRKIGRISLNDAIIQINTNRRIELTGTTIINGHRLYFSNSSTEPQFKENEDDIYLFTNKTTLPTTWGPWEEIKVYRRVRDIQN